MVSQTVMWTVDSAMVGHVGKTELAAVGLGGLMVFTLYSFFIGLSYGLNPFVAQSYGAKNHVDCARYMWQGIYIALASGLAILLVRQFNPWIVDLLGPAQDVRELCLSYIDIRMASGPFFIIHYYYSNFFRGLGNTRTPMKVAIFANVVNIVLDYLLIFGVGPLPALGVVGAALATFVANFLSAAILAIISFSTPYRRKYETNRHWRLHMEKVTSLLKIGAPIGVHYLLDMGSFLIFSAYIGRMGTEQLAANQIIIQILALSFMPCNGFSVAATTLMGQYIGAKSPNLAKKSAYTSVKFVLFFTCAVALVYMSFSEILIKIFNDDVTVVWYGKQLIVLAAVFQIFDGIQIVTAGALRGAGDTKIPMILALGGGWFVFLPLAFVFGTVLDHGVVGAWRGATIYIVLLGAAMFLRLKMDRWKRIKLISPAVDDSAT